MRYFFIQIVLLTAFLCTLYSQNKIDTLVSLNNFNGKLTVYVKAADIKSVKGTIVVLPGWKLPVLDWCTKTTLCEEALKQGYFLIMPEMAKSIYASERYPETRKDWLQYATREWFKDTLITYFQKNYHVLLPGQNNYVLGLSTGARGAALLSLDCPAIFKKGACLSGDFNQVNMPADALMTGWYGPITTFLARWKGRDNVVLRYKELKIPLYLGHGKADKVVPVNQTIEFGEILQKYKKQLVKLHLEEQAGHNYDYWNSEIKNVLEFFESK